MQRQSWFYVLIFGLLSLSEVYAQLDQSSFTATGRGGMATTFATDYHALGVNPANLAVRQNFRDPRLTFGFLEGNISFASNALSRNELLETIFPPEGATGFTIDEKFRAFEKMSNKQVSINMDITLAGLHISHPKWGGFGFSITNRAQFSARIGRQLSEIMFLGHNASYFDLLFLSNGESVPNTADLPDDIREQAFAGFVSNPTDAKTYSQLLSGSRISLSWFRELNFSYGKKIIDAYNFSMHLGAGIKRLSGIGLVELESDGEKLTGSTFSLSPTLGFGFIESAEGIQQPVFELPNSSLFQRLMFAESVGVGYGFDFGINMVIRRNLYIGASAVNIGNIKWQSGVAEITDGVLREIQGTGLNNYNIIQANESSLQFAGDKSPLNWERDANAPATTTQLPRIARVGMSYNYFKIFQIGTEVIYPLNSKGGNLHEPLIIVGGDWQINRRIRLSTGVSIGGNQGDYINIPMGIVFTTKRRRFETGIAFKDIRSIANTQNGSNISASFGLLRFKWNPRFLN